MRVSGCCGCFGLRTGTKIIAILGIIGSVISLFVQVVALASSEPHSDKASKGFSILLLVLFIICSGFLLKGVIEKKPEYFKYWITFKGILLGIGGISLIVIAFIFVLFPSEPEDEPKQTFVLMYIFFVVAYVLSLYWWVVARSYQAQLKGEAEANVV